MHVDELAEGLAAFVYSRRHTHGGYDWYTCRELPQGFCHIGVFNPVDGEVDGNWRYFRACDVGLVSKEMIEARIANKHRRLSEPASALQEPDFVS